MTKTTYRVLDLDGVFTETPDYMEAISEAVMRYRHWAMGDDLTAAEMTQVWEMRGGQKVADYDWQRAYRELSGHPSIAR